MLRKGDRLGIDADHTAFDFNTPFRSFLHDKYNISLSNGELNIESFGDVLKIKGKTPKEVVEEFLDKPAYTNLKPLPNAVDVIHFLANIFDLYLITARDNRFREITIANVEKCFGNSIPKKRILLSYNPYVNYGNVYGTKGEICVREDIKAMIDDSLTICLDCIRYGTYVYLFQPSQEGLDKISNLEREVQEKIIPVQGWLDIKKDVSRRYLPSKS